MTIPVFKKQTYGATVATILETDDSIVEVHERNDGVYGLIVHHRREDRDNWDDLTAYLKPEHFDALGSIAHRMRGEVTPDELATISIGEWLKLTQENADLKAALEGLSKAFDQMLFSVPGEREYDAQREAERLLNQSQAR
jgi:hypothetical protein